MHALSVDLADRAYPVLVGPGVRHEVARFVPPGAKLAAVVTQEGISTAGWLDGLDPGVPFEVCLDPRRRGVQDAGHRGDPGPAFRRLRPVPGRCGHRRGRRHRDRRGRVRRRHLSPGHGVHQCRYLTAGAGRCGHRRQDGGEPARGQEPGRRVLAAQRRSVRHRDAAFAVAARLGLRPGRDRQVRLLG